MPNLIRAATAAAQDARRWENVTCAPREHSSRSQLELIHLLDEILQSFPEVAA